MKLSHYLIAGISLFLIIFLAGLAFSDENGVSKSKSEKEKSQGCQSGCACCEGAKTTSSDDGAVVVKRSSDGDRLILIYLIDPGQSDNDTIKLLKSDIAEILKRTKVNSVEFRQGLSKILEKAGIVKSDSIGIMYNKAPGAYEVNIVESAREKESKDGDKKPVKIKVYRKTKDGKTEVEEREVQDEMITENEDSEIVIKTSENDNDKIFIIKSHGEDSADMKDDPALNEIKEMLGGYFKGDIPSLFADTNPDDVIKGADGSRVIVKVLADKGAILILVTDKGTNSERGLEKYYVEKSEKKTDTGKSGN